MIKIKVNNVAYELPERLTIEQWQKCSRYDLGDRAMWPTIVATAFNAPLNALTDAPEETLELGLGFVVELLSRKSECATRNLNELTFGDFIDLDVWLIDGLDKWLHKVANKCGQTEWADEALWLAHEAARWRNFIYKQYKELFAIGEYEEFSEKFDIEHVPNSGQEQARNWMQVLYELSNDNVLNIDPITNLPLLEALNFMAMRKERKQKELEQQKQNARKLKLA